MEVRPSISCLQRHTGGCSDHNYLAAVLALQMKQANVILYTYDVLHHRYLIELMVIPGWA